MTTTSAEDEFDAFVRARSAALGRTAYLLTGDVHLAEDLLQTALFKAARVWGRIEGDAEPYVRRILYHQNISWWRARKLKESALGAYDAPAAGSGDHELRLSLEQALAGLTLKQRTVLVLRYFEDLTEVETARELGIGLGTVKSTTRHALGRLRTLAPELADLIGADS